MKALQGGWPVFLATGFGVGLIPWAPGTWGTLLGVPLAWAIGLIPSVALQFLLIAALITLGVPLCTAAARRLGGAKDPGSIVLDEIVAVPVAFLLIPLDTWTVAAIGFVLFRLFDITKPRPAGSLEQLPAGTGIMADDLVAAVYANVTLRLALWGGASLGWTL